MVGWPLSLRGLGFYAVAVGVFAFLFTDIEGSTALLQRVGGTALSFDQAISLALEGASSAT